jgi:hypothetical protein
MKVSVFENQFTHERVICRDTTRPHLIDGEEYLRVQRYSAGNNAVTQYHEREFLVRRSALKPVPVK